MKNILTIIGFLLLAANAKAQSRDEAIIRQLLDGQVRAWNAGSLEAFMTGYWPSDSLLFIGKNGPKYGYNTTLENYQKSYPDTAAMGKLHFDILQTKRLSSEYFFVVGKWHLQRTAGDAQGYFSLLFQKIKNRWLIVADHSS